MAESIVKHSEYVSCIRINNIPILPPLMTASKRCEVRRLRKQATRVEQRLKRERDMRARIDELAKKSVTSFTPSQQAPLVSESCQTSSNEVKNLLGDASKVIDNVKSDLEKALEAIEMKASDLKSAREILKESEGVTSMRSVQSADCFTADLLGKETPRLVRSNSYVLDRPSPVLLEYMKCNNLFRSCSLEDVEGGGYERGDSGRSKRNIPRALEDDGSERTEGGRGNERESSDWTRNDSATPVFDESSSSCAECTGFRSFKETEKTILNGSNPKSAFNVDSVLDVSNFDDTTQPKMTETSSNDIRNISGFNENVLEMSNFEGDLSQIESEIATSGNLSNIHRSSCLEDDLSNIERSLDTLNIGVKMSNARSDFTPDLKTSNLTYVAPERTLTNDMKTKIEKLAWEKFGNEDITDRRMSSVTESFTFTGEQNPIEASFNETHATDEQNPNVTLTGEKSNVTFTGEKSNVISLGDRNSTVQYQDTNVTLNSDRKQTVNLTRESERESNQILSDDKCESDVDSESKPYKTSPIAGAVNCELKEKIKKLAWVKFAATNLVGETPRDTIVTLTGACNASILTFTSLDLSKRDGNVDDVNYESKADVGTVNLTPGTINTSTPREIIQSEVGATNLTGDSSSGIGSELKTCDGLTHSTKSSREINLTLKLTDVNYESESDTISVKSNSDSFSKAQLSDVTALEIQCKTKRKLDSERIEKRADSANLLISETNSNEKRAKLTGYEENEEKRGVSQLSHFHDDSLTDVTCAELQNLSDTESVTNSETRLKHFIDNNVPGVNLPPKLRSLFDGITPEYAQQVLVLLERQRVSKQEKSFTPREEAEERAAWILTAAARGFLTRRLLRTEKVENLKQVIKEALLCAVQLHAESVEEINESDVELHRRLIQQVSAACYAFHDVFFGTSIAERMSIIATDRQKKVERSRKRHSSASSNRSLAKSSASTPRISSKGSSTKRTSSSRTKRTSNSRTSINSF